MRQRILIFALCLSAISALSAGVFAVHGEREAELPVLMYHHMSEKKADEGKYVVSSETFEADLQWLRAEGYESITLRQLLAWYDGEGELPEKPVLITFDDGYESTLAYAGPLLGKYGFTAVVAIIGSVADQYSGSPDHNLKYSHLSWEAAAEMSRGEVFEIQCHSFDMHSLDDRRGCAPKKWEPEWDYRAALDEDLRIYFERCAQYGVDSVMSIAFPFGSYTQLTVDCVRDMGFRAAFTCEERINRLTGNAEELFHLYRFNRPGGVTAEEFFKKWQ